MFWVQGANESGGADIKHVSPTRSAQSHTHPIFFFMWGDCQICQTQWQGDKINRLTLNKYREERKLSDSMLKS